MIVTSLGQLLESSSLEASRRLPDSLHLEALGDLTAASWEYGYANLGHRLVYARKSFPPPGVGIGSSLSLLDKYALAVRGYARAHPFEDADPSSLSAQTGEPASAAQEELGEQQPIYVDETSASASGQQAMDAGTQHGDKSVASSSHHAPKRRDESCQEAF